MKQYLNMTLIIENNRGIIVKKKIILGLGVIILLLVTFLAGCVKPTEYMVSMRDGVKLATDVYVPNKYTQPHGAILIRTPYNKDGLILLGMDWAKSGWPTVGQDMRGRFASEGINTVFRNEQTDGPDTLAWIADQTWSNGKIATFGGSALGITQYLTAGANPPQLACQYIQVATPNLYKHAMYPGGEFRKNMVEEWLKGQDSTYILPELWAHENYTIDYWTNVSLEDNWQEVNVPAIHIGGWYDIFTQGTIDGFLGYQHQGGPGARGKSKLIIGPWTHGGAGTTKQGELTYPANAVDNFSQPLFWQMVNEYTMSGPTDFDNWPAVTYYLMGDVNDSNAPGNEWRYADDWPVPFTERAWFFQADGTLQTMIPVDTQPLTYAYDPIQPVPTIGGGNLNIPAGPYDQRPVENRSDVLVFTSPVLQQPYEATGPIKACLFVSSDCPDTDFTVKLTDVYPDGRSMLITDGILRMRNRNGTDHWELMNAGTVYQVDVDLWSTSYIWNTGHQIRVDISSSNYPRCLNNPNTADGIYKNTTFIIAHNTLYIDSIRPSCLLLPEIPLNTTTIQKNWSPSFQKNILIEDHPHLKLPERLQNILDHIPIFNQISEYHPFMIN
jgi:predicted acyl esterase